MRSWVKALVILAGSATIAAAQQEDRDAVGGFTELHRGQVAGETDLELVMGLVETAGQSISGKHYHPGGEFGFVLEGAITVSTEDEPEVTLRTGDSFYQPPGKWHVISTTAEETRGVVFRILKKGQPMVVGVE